MTELEMFESFKDIKRPCYKCGYREELNRICDAVNKEGYYNCPQCHTQHAQSKSKMIERNNLHMSDPHFNGLTPEHVQENALTA